MTRDIVDTALDSGLCCKLRQVWLLRPLVLQSTLRVILPLADARVARVVPRRSTLTVLHDDATQGDLVLSN